MARVTQNAFNGGIISEGMYARTDTEKFQKGVKDAFNMYVRPQGGLSNRAGTFGVTRFDTSAGAVPQHLIPFAYSTEQTYQLEFTAGVFRVIREGAYVLDSAVGAKSVSAISTAAVAELTLTTPGDAAQFPTGCLAFIRDPAGTHKLHEAVVRVASAVGGVITFQVYDNATLDTTTGDWGILGAGATLEKVYQQLHPYAAADLKNIRTAQDANTMYLAHPLYPPAKLSRNAHDNWALQNVNYAPSIGRVPAQSVALTAATATNPVVITAPGHSIVTGDYFKIDGVLGMVQLNKIGYGVVNSGVPSSQGTARAGSGGSLYKAGAVVGDTIALQSFNGEPLNGTAYPAYTSGGTLSTPAAAARYGTDVVATDLVEYTYAVAAISGDPQVEGLASTAFVVDNDMFFRGSQNLIGWKKVAGAERYNVYRSSAGALAFIGTTEDNIFFDENITPDEAYGPRVDFVPFAATGDYPAVVAFYEQRLAFGRTVNDPQLVHMSRVAAIDDFSEAYPSLPDDAFRFRIRDNQVNSIAAFVPSEVFLILTSRGEWEIAAQGDGEYQRPDKRKLAPRTQYGAAEIEPVYTGAVVLYVEPSKAVIRDYRPGDYGTPPGDLTVLAADLFEGKQITSWAYAASPDRVVWLTQSDGTLLSMTYVPEHDVWAWTRHQIAGLNARVEQVSTNREGFVDTVYLVVTRTINGVDVTMTERLAQREDQTVELCYYVDGGYRADFGGDVNSVMGLLHLRGETVTALVDGDVVVELLVDETGTVDLGDTQGRQISIGLPYESLMQTLDIQMEIKGLGSSEGRMKSTSEIAIKLRRTRGAEVGVDLNRMTALKEWSPAMVGGPIPLATHTPLFNVSGDWVQDATTYVRQRNPLPITVLSISPEWEVGE